MEVPLTLRYIKSMAPTRSLLILSLGLNWSCASSPDGLLDACDAVALSGAQDTTADGILPRLESAKNVLMISIDTLRIDRIGRYGCDKLSPFIDSLLAEATVLDNHRSCSSWTLPSATCVLTGQSPADLDFFPRITTGEPIPKIPLPTETIASVLGNAGFQSVLVSSNLYISERSRLDTGYDKTITKKQPAEVLLKTTLEEITAFQENDSDTPFFAHVHLIDPHTPYAPPESYLDGLTALPEVPWDLDSTAGTREMSEAWDDLSSAEKDATGQHLIYRYGAEVRYMDDELGKFFVSLENMNLLEDTLIVLWSDHGEQFWEHGAWGHGTSVHSGESRAIAAFMGPGVPTQAWKAPTTHTDLGPSLLSALGLAVPESWKGAIIGTHDESRPLFAATAPKNFPVSQSVALDDMLLIYDWEGGKSFFKHAEDPFEENNLYDADNADVQRLWTYLEPEVKRLESLLPELDGPVEIGP